MKRLLGTVLAVICILLITTCAILIAQKSLGRARVDLTERHLYTLSDGTRNILTGLNQPIRLKLYYARTAALKGPEAIRYYNNYYLYVRDLLEEYVSIAGGKLDLETIDPRKFSKEEEDALAQGVKSFPISEDENFFFGLVAQTELGKVDVIPVFEPQRQEFVEYDVSRLISALVQRKRKKIGVLSSLPVMGTDMSPYMMQMLRAQGRPTQEPWMVIKHLRQKYEVTSVDAETDMVDESIEFLLVIHPKELPEKTLYAIDQYVMKGGKLIVFQDAHCLIDTPPQDPSNPYAAMSYSHASDLNALLSNWGVEQSPEEIAADRALAIKAGSPRMPYLTLLDLNDNCVNADEVITADLHSMRMFFAGVLKKVDGAGTTVTPLLTTTSTGSTWKPASPFELMMPRPEAIRNAVVNGAEPVMLACRIAGALKTNFPDGPPDVEESEPETAEDKDDTEEAEEPSVPETLTESSGEAVVLVFSDVDMLSDQVAYQSSFFGTSQVGDNASLVFNALDFLGGSRDLIAIRSRGRFQRPFHVVDKIEADAEQATADEVAAINDKIKAAEERLRNIGTNAKDVKLVESAALAEQRQVNEEIRKFKKDLNNLKARKRDRIEALKASLQTHNMVWAPACVLLIAIVLGFIRSARARRYAAKRT